MKQKSLGVKARKRIGSVVYHCFMVLLSLTMIYPFVWSVLSSFKTSEQLYGGSPLDLSLIHICLCGFFGNNRLGVFFRRLLLGICCRFRLPHCLLSLGFSFLPCRAYQPLALILHSQRSPRLAALRSCIRRLYLSLIHIYAKMIQRGP